MADNAELLTGAEARRLSGVPTPTWLELLETGQLPDPVRVAGRYMWRREDILRWVREMKTSGVFA
ncbi:helix-turn-helix domain-containing protein [Neorhodopirellula pilleata]|uniref:Helix-turn-helix domain protein n=1 Tax=Neorhodopirellula pilleata TaxID=2714738 RepID=A0A5C5ZXG0_9BACT|nr:helix-turn-helix domain-containing protein [Neorhodopirellula pilleata]TWT91657.1 Helix-turn-helix domain protein [Neorhodopirellula pilleata]